MDFDEFLNFMAGGDPGAATAIQLMLAADGPRIAKALLVLDELDIRGALIWDAYSSICHMRPKTFFEKVENGTIAAELEKDPYVEYRRKDA